MGRLRPRRAQALREQLLAIEPFDVGNGLHAFYRLYAARFGKARWGDKTPSYSGHLVAIHAMLPEARFIHIIRDGRGVAESWRRMWFAPGKDMDTLAAAWQGCVREARRQSTLVPHYLELRYESLVRDQRGALEEVCAFLDLDFSDCMLHHDDGAADRLREHQGRSAVDGTVMLTQPQRLEQQAHSAQAPMVSLVDLWRQVLTGEEQQEFERVAGESFRELGYSSPAH